MVKIVRVARPLGKISANAAAFGAFPPRAHRQSRL
jgi:hypothetical protein